MVVDGSFADHQRACDFLIGLTGGQQFNNLKFPAGDVLAPIPLIYFYASLLFCPDQVRDLACASPKIVISAAGGHGLSAVISQFRPAWGA